MLKHKAPVGDPTIILSTIHTKHPFNTAWNVPKVDNINSMYIVHDKCYNESIEHKITYLPITPKQSFCHSNLRLPVTESTWSIFPMMPRQVMDPGSICVLPASCTR